LKNSQILPVNNEAQTSPSGPAFVHLNAGVNGLQNIVRVLMRRRRWIIGPMILCVLLALVMTAVMKPVYEATTVIELNKGNAGSMDISVSDILSQGLGGSTESLLTDLQTETNILQGDSLALAVMQKMNLAAQPEFEARGNALKLEDAEKGLSLDEAPVKRARLLKLYAKHLRVAPVHGTRLIRISFSSYDPRLAAQAANAIVDRYKAQYLKSHYDATSEASEWLTKQLSDLKSNVEESDKKLAAFERETGIINLNMMNPTGDGGDGNGGIVHSPVIQKLELLNTELTAAEANRIEREAIYRLASSSNSDALVALAASPSGLQGNSLGLSQNGIAALQQLRQQQKTLKMNLANATITYGANSRHIKEIEAQIAEVDQQLREELQQIAKLARSDLELAQQVENRLRSKFNEQEAQASKLNEKTVELAVLSQEAHSRKRLYEDLYTKLQEATVSAGIKATNITIVDPARSQTVPVRPKKMLNVEAGLAIGSLLGLILAFTVDRLDNTVINPLEVEGITDLPVLGIIPDFNAPLRGYGYGVRRDQAKAQKEKDAEKDGHPQSPQICMIDQPDSAASEAFRALRTSVLLSRAGGEARVVLVTSCVPGEGKSTVSVNLAISYAQHGRRTIIVESDMRRPTMPQVLDVNNTYGLSNVLSGDKTFQECVHKGVCTPMLDVLPAGPRPPMPAELLGSAVFDKLLESLAEEYDTVLIDSPPALLLTDAVSIATKTDVVVWVARAGVVTRPQLARAAQLIERHAIPVIGFALNCIGQGMDPYYSYSYGYGYGYGYMPYGRNSGDKSDEA